MFDDSVNWAISSLETRIPSEHTAQKKTTFGVTHKLCVTFCLSRCCAFLLLLFPGPDPTIDLKLWTSERVRARHAIINVVTAGLRYLLFESPYSFSIYSYVLYMLLCSIMPLFIVHMLARCCVRFAFESLLCLAHEMQFFCCWHHEFRKMHTFTITRQLLFIDNKGSMEFERRKKNTFEYDNTLGRSALRVPEELNWRISGR